MYNICVFAGTTEGRRIIEFLSRQNVKVMACVATEYGRELLTPSDNLDISARRLPIDEIIKLFEEEKFDLVIDATHPYAQSITESIASACSKCCIRYIRLIRDGSKIKGTHSENRAEAAADVIYVSDIDEAVNILSACEGNILLTTGSKDIGKFSAISGFADRVYARVLPMEDSIKLCRDAGLKPAHILAMQGPFSEEMDMAMLRFVSADWMVTKDGGRAGGFYEKVSAASKADVRLLVIGRPKQRDGISYYQTIRLLTEEYGCEDKTAVTVIGIGPGNKQLMTGEASAAIQCSDCIIGAKRMIEAVIRPGQASYEAIAPRDIADFIHGHREYSKYAVVMSGDVGFFSGTKKLLPLLNRCQVKVLPGISSLSYMCSRLNMSYEDMKLVSLHGRERDIVSDVRGSKKVFALTAGKTGVSDICYALKEKGYADAIIHVGERLSYPEERITTGTASELADNEFDPLSVVIIENKHPDKIVTHGIPDDEFIRSNEDKPVVPMTKSEVRAVALSKLQLTSHAICWDIGAGTGSVSVEMAIQASEGHVYAIEKRSDAVSLLNKNMQHFRVQNITVIEGNAPADCIDLPSPTHAFIGGSSGNMRDIIKLLVKKNPNIRIVATAVTLESTAELVGCMNMECFTDTQVISMNISRDKEAGKYHLMTAQNPVYIFMMQAGGNEN